MANPDDAGDDSDSGGGASYGTGQRLRASS